MKFSVQTLAYSRDLVKILESQRKKQKRLFSKQLLSLAEKDLDLFYAYCYYILGHQGVRLSLQDESNKEQEVGCLVDMMLYHEKGESWNVKLLEVMSLLT